MIPRFVKIAAFCLLFIIIAGASAYYTLTLIIKSENTVVVPDLIGENAVYALEILTDLGLNTKISESEYSSDFPKNHILYQDPEPGSEIKKGRDVKIIVSKGSRTIFTPNLEGLAVRQAHIILEENDLCRGKISSSLSDRIKKGEIISQSPSPGSAIRREECVDLLASMGNRQKAIMMPDLKNLSLDDAILSLEMDNLVLGDIESRFLEARPKNIILDQRPLSGYRVMEGSIVNLVRNRRTGKKEREHLYGARGGHLFRYRIKNGFLKTHIRVQLKDSGIFNDMFNDFAKPGEEIWLIIPDREIAIVTLYEDGKPKRIQLFNMGLTRKLDFFSVEL